MNVELNKKQFMLFILQGGINARYGTCCLSSQKK